MITCYLKYTIDPFKVEEFKKYAKMWIPLVEKFEGIHHGYFLPHESANNIAVALFSFKSLSMYEKYRIDSETDIACIKAYKFANKGQFIISYERNFLKPILNETYEKTN
ncbi:NIPSNAP family protein [Tenacibaculum halocynthiae]|uniref:NIPSNAP family protein n=1 Tax=Tenacibaculum halocynthiae TaxID=1254437 RepID=UPI003D65F1C4